MAALEFFLLLPVEGHVYEGLSSGTLEETGLIL
jgi:hypothetical protein